MQNHQKSTKRKNMRKLVRTSCDLRLIFFKLMLLILVCALEVRVVFVQMLQLTHSDLQLLVFSIQRILIFDLSLEGGNPIPRSLKRGMRSSN